MATQPKSETTAPAAGMPPKQKKRLLMVTNREEMRRLRAILRSLEAEIDWVPDVESSRSKLEGPGAYDAVVVDDKLPEEGWQQVMEVARELGVKTPFLVCTNLKGSDRFLTESKKTFIADLLMRPYVDAMVQARVRNALDSFQTEPQQGATVPSHQ